MATPDALKRTIPDYPDPPDLHTILAAYSASDVAIVPVGSETEAEQVRTAYAAKGGTNPVLVWRTDIRNLMLHPNTGGAGAAWEYLAGRQHGATVSLSTSNLRDARNDVLTPAGFARQSPGWALDASGFSVVIPQTGMYHMDVWGTVSGDAASLGRTYLEWVINDVARRGRQGVPNEDNVHGSLLLPLSAGDRVKVEYYHAAGGTRAFTGEMNIAQTQAPRW